jgi:hypothetical protein
VTVIPTFHDGILPLIVAGAHGISWQTISVQHHYFDRNNKQRLYSRIAHLDLAPTRKNESK